MLLNNELGDRRLQLPDENMFRYLAPTIAEMPTDDSVTPVIFRTAFEIETERRASKQS